MRVSAALIMLSSLALASVLALASAHLPAVAHAQEVSTDSADARARRHFEAGTAYYDVGDYESALRELRRAYDISHRAALLYNLYLTNERLGQFEDAARDLERYLAEETEVPNRSALEQRLERLRERAADVAPAEITADPTVTPVAGPSERVAPPSSDAPLLTITGFSVAGVGLVAAAIFSGLTLAEDGRLSALPCAGARSCPESEVGTLNTMALVSDISWGVSLAGAIVGTVFLFVPTGGSSSTETAAVRVSPWLGQVNGLSLTGSF